MNNEIKEFEEKIAPLTELEVKVHDMWLKGDNDGVKHREKIEKRIKEQTQKKIIVLFSYKQKDKLATHDMKYMFCSKSNNSPLKDMVEAVADLLNGLTFQSNGE